MTTKNRKMTPVPEKHPLVGPRREDETLEQFYARYHEYNEELLKKYPPTPREQPAAQEVTGNYQRISCSVCGARAEGAEKILDATRIAQRAGFTHRRHPDGRSVRDAFNQLVWVCAAHGPAQKGGQP